MMMCFLRDYVPGLRKGVVSHFDGFWRKENFSEVLKKKIKVSKDGLESWLVSCGEMDKASNVVG